MLGWNHSSESCVAKYNGDMVGKANFQSCGEYKTGTLEEYLPGVEKYLEEKAMQMGKKLSVTADLQSKKMQVAGEKKKETKRDCKKSETVI